jgi:hypothetical protein
VDIDRVRGHFYADRAPGTRTGRWFMDGRRSRSRGGSNHSRRYGSGRRCGGRRQSSGW